MRKHAGGLRDQEYEVLRKAGGDRYAPASKNVKVTLGLPLGRWAYFWVGPPWIRTATTSRQGSKINQSNKCIVYNVHVKKILN